MRSKRAVVGLAFSALFACQVAFAQVEGSRAFTFPENDNRLITVQAKGGNHETAGAVKIECYGHAAFKLTSPEGTTVLVDPWRNDPTGAWGKWFPHEFPEIPADVVISTHAHFDQDAVQRPHALLVMERFVGEFTMYKEIDAIVRKYHPKAVIPAHYKVDGVESALSGLKSADGWVQTQHDVRRLDTATLELTAAELSGAKGRVYYFGNHFEEK